MDLAQLPSSTASAALTFFGIISPRRRLRSEIAADIALRDQLSPGSEAHQMLDVRITRDVAWLTGFLAPEVQKKTNWSTVVFGVLMLAGFGWWTVRLAQSDSWWGFATGFAAFLGFAAIMGSREVVRSTDGATYSAAVSGAFVADPGAAVEVGDEEPDPNHGGRRAATSEADAVAPAPGTG